MEEAPEVIGFPKASAIWNWTPGLAPPITLPAVTVVGGCCNTVSCAAAAGTTVVPAPLVRFARLPLVALNV